MKKWFSRKLFVAVLTPIVTGILSRFGVDPMVAITVVGALATYIFGQALVDTAAVKSGKVAPEPPLVDK